MTILAVSIIGIVHLDMIFYKAGLVNEQVFMAFFGILFFVSLYEISKIAIVIFAVMRIFFHLKPDERNKRYAITALVSFLIFIGSWVFFFTLHQPGAVHYLRGYGKWVTKNIDIDSIQTWILSQEADKYSDHTYDRASIPSDLPDFIRNVNPEWIYIRKNETGRCIKLTWRHGISEYKGIVVGSPEMKQKRKC